MSLIAIGPLVNKFCTLKPELRSVEVFVAFLDNKQLSNEMEISAGSYAKVIELATTEYEVPPESIAEVLDVSTQKIKDWCDPEKTPRPYTVGMVVQVLKSLMYKKLREEADA